MDAGSCQALHQAYAALRQEDTEIARLAVAKLDGQIVYQQFIVQGHQALADSGAIDPRVVWEDRQELAAMQAKRDAAEVAYEQLRGKTDATGAVVIRRVLWLDRIGSLTGMMSTES